MLSLDANLRIVEMSSHVFFRFIFWHRIQKLVDFFLQVIQYDFRKYWRVARESISMKSFHSKLNVLSTQIRTSAKLNRFKWLAGIKIKHILFSAIHAIKMLTVNKKPMRKLVQVRKMLVLCNVNIMNAWIKMPTFKMCAFASVSGSDLNEPQMKKKLKWRSNEQQQRYLNCWGANVNFISFE